MEKNKVQKYVENAGKDDITDIILLLLAGRRENIEFAKDQIEEFWDHYTFQEQEKEIDGDKK